MSKGTLEACKVCFITVVNLCLSCIQNGVKPSLKQTAAWTSRLRRALKCSKGIFFQRIFKTHLLGNYFWELMRKLCQMAQKKPVKLYQFNGCQWPYIRSLLPPENHTQRKKWWLGDTTWMCQIGLETVWVIWKISLNELMHFSPEAHSLQSNSW